MEISTENWCKKPKNRSIFSKNISFQKQNKSTEEPPSSVQKLLASLQQAQNKSDLSEQPSTSKPKKNEKRKKAVAQAPASAPAPGPEEKKKQPKRASVGARMQQQAENARISQTKRPRQVSTSKGSSRNTTAPEQQNYQQQQQQYKGPRIPTDILDELEFRFISNMVECEVRKGFGIGNSWKKIEKK